jgi:glycerate 2-kinase
MFDMASSCTEKDLVITAITGGSSALLPLPVEGVSLDDKKKVNEILLFCGADITQINAVRKHLSRIKGGRLAKAILPATIINLTVSDVNGDPLDYITCPTVPDTSTFDDARKVLDEFDLWEKFPKSAADHLRQGGEEHETPKEIDFKGEPLHTFIVVNSAAACLAAEKRSKELGYQPMILTTMMKGEARDAGSLFASIGIEIAKFGRPLKSPCVVIAGGENTVTIQGEFGIGGPNQEFVLSAALDIAGLEKIVIASLDTDGTDGPNELAGGMVDGSSIAAARMKNLDVAQALRKHNVSPLLRSIGDELFSGPTGTNINDLKLLLVSN